jgi:hypothetical protein
VGRLAAAGRALRPPPPDRRRSPALRLLGRRDGDRRGGGEALGDPADLGLDAAFPALFLALLVPQVRTRRPRRGDRRRDVALVLLPFTATGVPIIAAGAACLLGLRES